MPLTVSTNIAALKALTQLQRTNRNLTAVFGRIASGSRIAKSSDDAAGLAVAESLRVERSGLMVARRNIEDGISVTEIAEGAIAEVSNIVKRLRDLAIQSSSESLDDQQRSYIQQEADELTAEITRIATITNYNGVSLTDGSATTLLIHVGPDGRSFDQVIIELPDLTTAPTVDLDDSSNAFAAITLLDTFMDDISAARATLGAGQSRLESALRIAENTYETYTGAESRIRDADFAYETAEMSRWTILQNAGMATLAQANQINQGALALIGG